MKYLILLCDGMSDMPVDQLGGKTPMQAADKPNIDRLAKHSKFGMCRTVPVGMSPGSDVANLSVLGYNPAEGYTGRSPLEAASLGIELSDTDVTFRCNFVTLSDDESYKNKTMVDYSAGDIETEEAAQLIQTLNEQLHLDGMKFFPGFGYRHILLWHGGNTGHGCTPPHDISGQVISGHIDKSELFSGMMEKSYEILKNHPVNIERVNKGLRPANSIWLWGVGTKPKLESFEKKYGLTGAIVTAVDLLKGIGKVIGMSTPTVEGATGYIDTNFEGKAAAALAEFESGKDLVYLHVEAPDECGHRFEIDNKKLAIELIDRRVLTHMLEGLDKYDDYKILIMPDHPTIVATGAHSSDPVPWLIYQKSEQYSGVDKFCENSASQGPLIDPGYDIMKLLLDL